jgi:hypothetical protein
MHDVLRVMSDPIPPFDELPELTLSLRSFGSRRRSPNEDASLHDEQARFFAPLLDARRAAAVAVTRLQVVAAFDARRIGALLDATMRSFAAERFQTRAPARRAVEAELFEIVEPLRAALRELRNRAEVVVGAQDPREQYEQWMIWFDGLRTAFRTADDIWPHLARALEALPQTASKASRGSRAHREGPK